MTDQAQTFVVSAGGDGYVFAVGEDRRFHQIAFGAGTAERTTAFPNPDGSTVDLPVGIYPLAYPTYGEEPMREPALRVTHADGVTSTRLTFDAHERTEAPAGGLHRFHLVDEAEPLEVVLCFRTWDAVHVVEQWVEVTNRQAGPVVVHELAAASPALAGLDCWLTHFGEGWGAEWNRTRERLSYGTKVVSSKGGVQPHLAKAPFFLLEPSGPAHETSGQVIGAALAWQGNTRFAFEMVPPLNQLRVLAGHNPLGTDIRLEPGEAFESPHLHVTCSEQGLEPVTHRFHAHVRQHVVRDGERFRSVVANNWEATLFFFNERKLTDLVSEAADIGAEVFLLDDGWFGTEHPRDTEEAGLGDWEVNRAKLPNGLEPVAKHAARKGIRFGLWIEPEMVNERSRLYGEHPDWVVSQPGRYRRLERWQMVLDVCRPEVAEHAAAVADQVLAETPGITYMKWDANRRVSEPGSTALTPERQGRYWVDSALATWQVMATVAERHPEVELMLCASGGGRVDIGTLRYFHEVWTSDNTDAVERVRLQWGASIFLPPKVLAAHATRMGWRPIAFACAVAMSCRFGYDLDLTTLKDGEKGTCRRAAAAYRSVRDLVQHGRLHRLVSPYEGERAALAYTDEGGARGVVFAYQLGADPPGWERTHPEGTRIKLRGLDPSAGYRLAPVRLDDGDGSGDAGGRSGAALHDGAALLADGIPWPLSEPATAAIWTLEREA